MTIDPDPQRPAAADTLASATVPAAGPVLGAGERAIVAALREIVSGPTGWAVARERFHHAVGFAHLALAVTAFDRMLGVVLGGARRPFAVRPPAAPGIGADELALVNLIAAAQSGAFAHAGALARWLVVPSCQARLVSAAVRVGAALGAGGVTLVPRRGAGAPDYRFD